jgi:hypothetical protein
MYAEKSDTIVTAMPELFLTKQELRVIYNLIKAQYISYDNPDALALIKKIRLILFQD